jgi:hypothetical protein
MSPVASRPNLETRPTRPPSRLDGPHAVGAQAPPARRRRAGLVPWGVIGMCGLIVAIEASVARRWPDLSDPVSLSWRFADRAARNDAAGCDVLFLGDSLVKHGLVPSVLQRASGLRSVNLAAARAPTLLTYFVLRRALDARARPSAIVIDTKPAVLIGGADYNAQYWPATLSAPECLELGWIAGKGPLALAVLTARLLPSLQSRLGVRSRVEAALTQAPERIREINRVLLRNWTVNGGANVAMMNSAYRGDLSPEIQDRLHPDRWYVDPANAAGLEQLLKLAARRGIRVFWLLPPISPGLQDWRERSGSEAKYEQFVRSYCERYPSVVSVLDARRMARDTSLYVDATHLSGRGATVLSRAVGAVLKAELAQPAANPPGGWITLQDPARDADGSADPPLEDVERSKELVRGGTA